jgi:hypothetical protein
MTTVAQRLLPPLFLSVIALFIATCSKSTDSTNDQTGGPGPTVLTRDQIVGTWQQTMLMDMQITTSSRQSALAAWLPGTGQIAYSGTHTGTLAYFRRYKFIDYGDTTAVCEVTEKSQNDTTCLYFLHIEKNGTQYTAYFDYTLDAINTTFYSSQSPAGITYDMTDSSITMNTVTLYNDDDPNDSIVFNGTLRSAEMTVPANTKTFLYSYQENRRDHVYEIFSADNSYQYVVYFPGDSSIGYSSVGTWSYANGIITAYSRSVDEFGDTLADTMSIVPTMQNNAAVMTFTISNVDYCQSGEYSSTAECIEQNEYEYGLDQGSLTNVSLTNHITYTRVTAAVPKTANINAPVPLKRSAQFNAAATDQSCRWCQRSLR